MTRMERLEKMEHMMQEALRVVDGAVAEFSYELDEEDKPGIGQRYQLMSALLIRDGLLEVATALREAPGVDLSRVEEAIDRLSHSRFAS